eukprot:COSAG02_NODE_52940_length_305_cov_0.402913_1_plen_33_part_10
MHPPPAAADNLTRLGRGLREHPGKLLIRSIRPS